MSEKPRMYQNKNKVKFNNNKAVFRASLEEKINIPDNRSVRKKIMDIINANDFIYRSKVKLIIDNQILEKKIIGINGNNLITIDNEYIPIDKIKDIYK